MCRLFGMSASPRRVHASFWLLEVPDSRPLEPGELAHIKPDLSVTSAVVVDGPPAQVLHLDHPTGQERS